MGYEFKVIPDQKRGSLRSRVGIVPQRIDHTRKHAKRAEKWRSHVDARLTSSVNHSFRSSDPLLERVALVRRRREEIPHVLVRTSLFPVCVPSRR